MQTDIKNISREEMGIHIIPKGYRIFVRAPYIPERRVSGLYLPEDSTESASRTCCIGKVLAIGEDAFANNGAAFFTDIGKWVIYSKYERELITNTVKGKKLIGYFINDDRILAEISKEDMETLSDGGE